jgi:hypothetical protein
MILAAAVDVGFAAVLPAIGHQVTSFRGRVSIGRRRRFRRAVYR